MQDILILAGILLAFLSPFVIIAWVIYRMIKGSGGGNNSITGR